ncbi:MAG: hypothetical protein Unbinned2990contig1001_56 [Prokaryotic dsDNA virus sp.]|nr:MAG: hypothetical protein Unbinned2990contig1001_56 [Prokaryotic dsDNA virus sp.]
MLTIKITEKQLNSLMDYLIDIDYHQNLIPFKSLAKIGLVPTYNGEDLACSSYDEVEPSLQNFYLVNEMYESMKQDPIMQINIFDVEKFIHINGSNAYEADYWEGVDELRNQAKPNCNCGKCNYISESYLSA